MLDATPIRNVSAIVTTDRDGIVTIKVKRKRPKYLIPPLSWILVIRPYRTTTLDALGSSIWQMCGNDKSVETLIDEFATTHDLTFHEGRISVTSYLKDLIQRGILAIAIDEEDD